MLTEEIVPSFVRDVFFLFLIIGIQHDYKNIIENEKADILK